MTDTAAQTITVEERCQRIDALDLEPITFKLSNPEDPDNGMSLAEADRRVKLYRLFLKLHVLHPEAHLVPTKEMDEVWHTHILDTRKYAADCAEIFGFFLHHFPYLGMRGEADATDWKAKGSATRELFRREFGTDPLDIDGAGSCKSHGGGGMCVTGECEQAMSGERPRPDRSAMSTA